MSTPEQTLSHAHIQQALREQPLFDDKTWQLSPQPWPLSASQVKEIAQIGAACLSFHKTLELLYTRSWQGKNLLRNQPLLAPWVAEYLDRGKPQPIIDYARDKAARNTFPRVIRPDLLLTEEGFVLTEIDSVPGGIGLTGFLNQLYKPVAGQSLIGAGDEMIDNFYAAIASLAPDKKLPFIAILVSDEASTYRPEMDWLAAHLQRRGKRVYCFHPSEVMPLGDTLCADIEGNPEQVDVVYRFWELFDLPNIPVAEHILKVWQAGQVAITAPIRHFQEEKLNLALFHHTQLEPFWKENLPKAHYKLLKRIIPPSWIMDPVELPPNAVLQAPLIGGKPIWRWEQLGEASQKERNLIMKLSGFHENAWGARSVLLGNDVSRQEWQDGIQAALELSEHNLTILQEYRKPMRLTHPIFREGEETYPMQGRLRLCPYYFVVDDTAELSGILATYCPADKKIIHGMSDAALLPCILQDEPARD